MTTKTHLDYASPDRLSRSGWAVSALLLVAVGSGWPVMLLAAVERRIVTSSHNSFWRLAAVAYLCVALVSLLAGMWCASVAVRRAATTPVLAWVVYWAGAVSIVALLGGFTSAAPWATGQLWRRLLPAVVLAVGVVLVSPTSWK